MGFLLLLSPILLGMTFMLLQRIKRQKPSPKPPGPWGLPYFGNLFQLDVANPHIYLQHLAKKYGPLMSLKLGSVSVIVVSSPRIAKEVMRTHDITFSNRAKFMGQQKLSYNGSDIVFSPYGPIWRELKKISILHLLSAKQIHSFRPVREEEVLEMIGEVSTKARSSMTVNLSEMMHIFSCSLISRIAFGKKFEEGEAEKVQFDSLTLEVQALFAGFYISDYLPLFGWMDKHRGLIGRLDRVCKSLDAFYQDIIDQHLDPIRKKSVTPDFIDILIRLKQENTCSIDLTWDHIKAILMNVFIAATDTSSAVITWSMTALMQNPTKMKKLQGEIRGVVKHQGIVKEDDITKLPYLKAVIREAMRLFPPTPLLVHREARESCILEGYKIPSETQVYINAYAIARDPEYWDNPEEFLPERFLNTNIDIIGNDFQVIPFGAGRRMCPGITMGLVTVELALANLVHSFNWELPPGMNTEDIDIEVSPGLTMHKKTQLCLVPKIYTFQD